MFMVATFSKKSIVIGPFLSEKTVTMTWFTDSYVQNFFFIGKSVCFYFIDFSTKQKLDWPLLKTKTLFNLPSCSVGWCFRIYCLFLCRGVRTPSPKEYPRYDTKKSDGVVPVMLELWGMQSAPSLPSFPGPLWAGVVSPDGVLSMG